MKSQGNLGAVARHPGRADPARGLVDDVADWQLDATFAADIAHDHQVLAVGHPVRLPHIVEQLARSGTAANRDLGERSRAFKGGGVPPWSHDDRQHMPFDDTASSPVSERPSA